MPVTKNRKSNNKSHAALKPETTQEKQEPDTEPGAATELGPATEPGAVTEVNQKNKVGAKKNKKKRKQSFNCYIYKVLKQVHPATGIGKTAMTVLNTFANDILDKLTKEASNLALYAGTKTLRTRDIASAVKLHLPGELAKHAMSEGIKAVTKFRSS